jgi:phosphotransferase system  glucose/maltose/N-acetylglucosamine-specific IIC component
MAARRRYFLFGLFVPIAILIAASIILIVNTALSYNGKCGGFLPWLAGPKPCSLWEYVYGNSLAIIAVVGISYWPVILALIFVPALIGFSVDRQNQRKSENLS